MSDERPLYEQAYDDYKKGLKYKEIAEKYGVSINTVKSWKSRYWGKKSVQPKTEKVAHKKEKGCTQKKVGAPEGNKNGVGNSGGGAPKGNKNNIIHGAYAKLYEGLLEPELLSYFNEIDFSNTLDEFKEKLRDLKKREAFLLQQIRELNIKYRAGGVGIQDVSKNKTTNSKGEETQTMKTRTLALHSLLQPLQSELSKVQKNIIKILDSISRIESDCKKIIISTSKLNIEQQKLVMEADKVKKQNDGGEDKDIHIKIMIGDDEF